MNSIRDGFGEALVELGNSNPDVVVFTADLADSTRVKEFAEKFPEDSSRSVLPNRLW